MPRFAFKEWAVICDALSRGEQALILRKGGIAEENGEFRPDHARFWLFATYLHQKPDGLKPTAAASGPENVCMVVERVAAVAGETMIAGPFATEAEAKTAERIAAERYGAASPQPLPVTSRGDTKASELVTKFKAITDPKEQTAFWRGLTAEQRTLILNAQ